MPATVLILDVARFISYAEEFGGIRYADGRGWKGVWVNLAAADWERHVL